MSSRIDVFLLPDSVEPRELRGTTVVVIDVLRAGTTIITALAAGATEVIPCAEVEEARRIYQDRKDTLLAGERGGLAVPGFDLGNSPADFGSQVVEGKTIVFTTTNGTTAMQRCRQADRVLIGSFVNLSAVCNELAGQTHVALLCAGTNKQVTREDVLLAGAVTDRLRQEPSGDIQVNDQAQIAADAWSRAAEQFAAGVPLAETLRTSHGGRNLIQLGMQRDIEIAAQIDRYDIVPELHLTDWRIT